MHTLQQARRPVNTSHWKLDAGRTRMELSVRRLASRRVFGSARRARLRDLLDDRNLDVVVHAEWIPSTPPSAA